MKYAPLFGLLAVAAAALMAFTGTASATQLTSPAGTVYTSTIKAASEGSTSLHNTSLGITTTCTASTVEGKVESHGAATTAAGKISSLTFTGCGVSDVTVLSPGSLEVHTASGSADGNGTLTSTGAEITVLQTAIGVSCGYKTTSTDIGTRTGGTPATLSISSAVIPRTFDSIFCGSSGQWTGGSFRRARPEWWAAGWPSPPRCSCAHLVGKRAGDIKARHDGADADGTDRT